MPVITPLNRRLRIAATVIVSIAGLIGLAFLATYYYLKPTLPDVAVLRDVRLQVPLRVYSRDGKLLAQLGEQRRVPVAWQEIPEVVVQAVLAAEDDRFFEHPGVDWQGITRAVLVAATTMELSQGGSTLTQQLVRTTLITKEKQLRRKLREVFLALSLENELSKQEIFTLFVNTQFLGQRSYGFAAASETYFGKALSQVNAAEAALLAGILQAPSRQNPVASVAQASERRAYVLRRMRELGYLDEPAWQAAMDEPVPRGLHGPRVQVDAPYVGEMVRLVLHERYGDRIYSDGFQVVTTVDSRLQRAADIALRSAVLEYDRRHGWRGPAGHVDVRKEADEALAALIEERPVVGGLIPAIVVRTGAEEATVVARSGLRYRLGMEGIRWARTGDVTPKSPRDVLKIGDVVYVLPTGEGEALLAQLPEVQGAFVALDPHDGAIVALSGGFDYDASKFNRAVQARRQPGSSFKPFIYSAALEAGLTPATVVLDAPVVY
jgi:penicillin-binding protein 1A